MAGYYIYSLDWTTFQRFVADPSRDQLLALAGLVSDGLDREDGVIEPTDPLQDWPSEPEELVPIVRTRLALPDWYADLTYPGKEIWQRAVTHLCDDARKKEFGFRVETQVYWDAIEDAQAFHGLGTGGATDAILGQFGSHPFRYQPPATTLRRLRRGGWTPNHSMHGPVEVEQLRGELRAAGPTVRATRGSGWPAFERNLMPAIERIVHERRLLYVVVDT